MPEHSLDAVGSGAKATSGGAGKALADAGAEALRQHDLAHFLTDVAEDGKGVLVNQILFGMTSGQRIDLLRQMDVINQAHRKTNHNLPDLVINYDKQGYSLAVDYPGTKDDKVIWSAKVNEKDQLTKVVCETAKQPKRETTGGPPGVPPDGGKPNPPSRRDQPQPQQRYKNNKA